jgi:hypothetical protein
MKDIASSEGKIPIEDITLCLLIILVKENYQKKEETQEYLLSHVLLITRGYPARCCGTLQKQLLNTGNVDSL